MTTTSTQSKLRIPTKFVPPVVKNQNDGEDAFHSYDWYFEWMQKFLADKDKVFLTPCAATKPICQSSLHRSVYQKYLAAKGAGRESLVVSEPVVLIRYPDLYDHEKLFCYDFPPKLLSQETRSFFVQRLKMLLVGKDIEGCLPRHHASLINDAVGTDWKNYWRGDMLAMMKTANNL